MRRHLLIAAVCWSAGLLPATLALQPGHLRLAVLDVGQGDAVLLQTPNGRRILVDGGPDRRVLSELGTVLRGTDRRIDLLVLTHPHADHFAGIPSVLEHWDVGRVALTGAVGDSVGFRSLVQGFHDAHVPVTWLASPQQFRIDGVTLDVLWPLAPQVGKATRAPNDDSVVLRVTYGGSRILLTGDLEKGGEATLVRREPDLRADILKAGHHGSKTSSTKPFLDAVQPRFLPISVGVRNRHRHPSPETIDRADASGIAVRRTDLEGTLRYACDQRCCWSVSSDVFSREGSCGIIP